MTAQEAVGKETPTFVCKAPENCEFAKTADLPMSLIGEFCEEIRELHLRSFGRLQLKEQFDDYEAMCPLEADASLEIG